MEEFEPFDAEPGIDPEEEAAMWELEREEAQMTEKRQPKPASALSAADVQTAVKRQRVQTPAYASFSHSSISNEEEAELRRLEGGSSTVDLTGGDYGIAGVDRPEEPETEITSKTNDRCRSCGKLGHWAANCPNAQNQPSQLACPCGKGPCTVLTAKTERNMGRQFYRCPVRDSDGGCSFFQWCDSNPPAALNSTSPAKQGAGKMGGGICSQKDVSSALVSGDACFKCGQAGHWARDCPGAPTRAPLAGGGSGYGGGYSGGGGCAGVEAVGSSGGRSGVGKADVSAGRSSYGGGSYGVGGYGGGSGYFGGGGGGSSGGGIGVGGGGGTGGAPCFKCGQAGHWARDCPSSTSCGGFAGRGSGPPARSTGSGGGGGSCFKCGGSGHWARNCPN